MVPETTFLCRMMRVEFGPVVTVSRDPSFTWHPSPVPLHPPSSEVDTLVKPIQPSSLSAASCHQEKAHRCTDCAKTFSHPTTLQKPSSLSYRRESLRMRYIYVQEVIFAKGYLSARTSVDIMANVLYASAHLQPQSIGEELSMRP